METEVGETAPDNVPSEVEMHDPIDGPADHFIDLTALAAGAACTQYAPTRGLELLITYANGAYYLRYITESISKHRFRADCCTGNQTAVNNCVRGIIDDRIIRRETGEHLDVVGEVAAQSNILDVNTAIPLHERYLSPHLCRFVSSIGQVLNRYPSPWNFLFRLSCPTIMRWSTIVDPGAFSSRSSS